jgi:hypothetical protein
VLLFRRDGPNQDCKIVSSFDRTRAKKDRRRKLRALDEFIVLVDVPSRLVLHLLGDVLQERAPFWSGTKLRQIEGRHLNALVGTEDEATARHVVDMVDVCCGSDGRKV